MDEVATIDAPGIVSAMSDRELLEELVTATRELKVTLKNAGKALDSNPMLRTLSGSLGSLLGKL